MHFKEQRKAKPPKTRNLKKDHTDTVHREVTKTLAQGGSQDTRDYEDLSMGSL